jgi:hypothetical protein
LIFFSEKAYFLKQSIQSPTINYATQMPEDASTTQTAPAILQNARVKKASKTKGISKTRKARPLKNLDIAVLQSRLQELQKRVRTAECKMTLLKEKLVVHEDEAATRAALPAEGLAAKGDENVEMTETPAE